MQPAWGWAAGMKRTQVSGQLFGWPRFYVYEELVFSFFCKYVLLALASSCRHSERLCSTHVHHYQAHLGLSQDWNLVGHLTLVSISDSAGRGSRFRTNPSWTIVRVLSNMNGNLYRKLCRKIRNQRWRGEVKNLYQYVSHCSRWLPIGSHWCLCIPL